MNVPSKYIVVNPEWETIMKASNMTEDKINAVLRQAQDWQINTDLYEFTEDKRAIADGGIFGVTETPISNEQDAREENTESQTGKEEETEDQPGEDKEPEVISTVNVDDMQRMALNFIYSELVTAGIIKEVKQ